MPDDSRSDPITEARLEAAAPVSLRRPRHALLIMSPKGTAALFTLPESGEVTIGRSDRCTLQIEDALLSRVHAILRPAHPGYEIADEGSTNGTWIGSERLEPHVPRPLSVGDTIKLGNTNLVLQFAAGGARPRRLWTHEYFEARLEDECARAEEGGKPFAVVRVRAAPASPKGTLEKALAELLRPIDLLATYAERDYEILLVETTPEGAEAMMGEIRSRLAAEELSADVTVACYPHDGRTPEALIARAGPRDAPSAGGRVVQAGALARLDKLVERVASSTISVLVLGETGVGKEVLARMIHERSPRAKKTLVCLNCASLSESLLESELFGHEKGAFTGAIAAKQGLLEAANGGTAFFDEIGEMPVALQAKLLRVLEQREVQRVGALVPRPIDVRFVAATNRDLEKEIERGRFRQDLYFRLNGFSIVVPPLRERTEEIQPLARHFVRVACEQMKRSLLELSPEALRWLEAYEWPGNIRELKNVIDRAILLCSGRTITLEHLPREKVARLIAPSAPRPASVVPRAQIPSDVEITVAHAGAATIPPAPPTAPLLEGEDAERRRIVAALEQCAWNQTQAAKVLGISRQTLVTRIETYNLPRPRKRV